MAAEDRSDPPSSPLPSTDLARLLDLVARLRAPGGCPWDRQQGLDDVRAYLLEEAHELAAAMDAGDWPAVAGEAGDLLFQVAFVLRLGEEAGRLRAGEALDGIEAKMIARHPHVFGDEADRLEDAEAVSRAWESRKARQRREGESHLDGVPPTLPALLAAYRLSQKAAGVGFDWPAAEPVLDKVEEELDEVRREMEPARREGDGGRERLREEVGDLLFTVANLARKLGFDPEAALADANAKFRRRFGHVERRLREEGEALDEAGLERLEELWAEAKGEEEAGQASRPLD